MLRDLLQKAILVWHTAGSEALLRKDASFRSRKFAFTDLARQVLVRDLSQLLILIGLKIIHLGDLKFKLRIRDMMMRISMLVLCSPFV